MKKNPQKRTASDLDDAVGTVKVTLAYDVSSKPTNTDHTNQQQSRFNRTPNNNSSDISNNNDGRQGGSGYQGGPGYQGGHHSKERDRDDRDSEYSASNNNFSGANDIGNNQQPSLLRGHQSSGYSMPLSGANAYPRGSNEEKIEIIIPHAVIGLVIGKGGENIKRIQNESGAIVRVDPNTVDEKGNKVCTITGTKQAVDEAHAQIANVIENAGSERKRSRMQLDGSEYKMKIPASRTGAIIGKGGETIKQIKQQSNCDIELDKNAKECAPNESLFIIRGDQENILIAKSMIEARLSRGRDDGGRDRDRDRDRDRHSRSQPQGLATGANAAPVAPVAQIPGMPDPTAAAAAAFTAQANSDNSIAWSAYMAQYNAFISQGAANVTQAGTMPALQSEQPQGVAAPPAAVAGQKDYTDDWIEYYMANGRPDYAQQLIEMKKQQQQQMTIK